MLQPPRKFVDRVGSSLKRLQSVAQTCQSRDVNESDTVTLVMDILCDVLGYDKYEEVTKEHQIRSTYCDLAVQIGGKLYVLIEVKAIGLSLKENHIQQALNYAANKGCEWVILTNAVTWQLYRVIFGQPITSELVLEFAFLDLNPKKAQDLETLYTVSREGADKATFAEYHASLQAKDRYCIAAILASEPVLKLIRKELRAMNPNVQVGLDEIREVIQSQVLKRDVIEGEKAMVAEKKFKRHQKKQERQKGKPGGSLATASFDKDSGVAAASDEGPSDDAAD